MKKMIFIVVAIIIAICIGIGVGYFLLAPQGFQPSLNIVGDIKETITLKDLSEYESQTFIYEGEKLEGVLVQSVLERAGLVNSNSNIYYIGSDGLTAEVDATTLSESYLLFNAENGWEMINLNHPVSANIKLLTDIVVVSQEEITDGSFTIFTDEANLFSVTPGKMYMDDYSYFRKLEGESNFKDNFVRIYTSYKTYDMEQLINKEGEANSNATSGTLFLENGQIINAKLDGYLQCDKNQINYLSYNEEYEYMDVVGLYLGEPLGYVGDAYYDMQYYLEKGENVFLLFIDGFNYQTYTTAKERGIIPNISSGTMKKSLSVHTSVTNAGFASMITGKTPDVNGVHSRAERKLLCDSIFKIAKDKNIDTAFLEGSTRILDTEISPKLHVRGDLEILESTKKAVEEDKEFIFVHLHELDEKGHTYGPKHQSLFDYLEEVDKLIGEILKEYEGQLIITTDHGMHSIGEAGGHGIMRYEDMIIPTLTKKVN